MSPRAGWTAGRAALILSLVWLLAPEPGPVVAAAHEEGETVDAERFTRRLYVGGGVGGSRVEPESPIFDLVVGDKNDTGFNLMLGYDFSRRLSAELYAADLGAARIDRRTVGAEERDFDAIDYRILDVAALIYLFDFRRGGDGDRRSGGLWRREGPSLYGRLGAGVMRNDDERGRVRHFRENDAHLTIGLGLEYGFRNGVALRAEYTSFDTDARYASLGVLKRFGQVRVPPVVQPPPTCLEGPDPCSCPEPPASCEPPPPSPPPQMLSASSNFDFDSAVLKEEGRNALDGIAAEIADDASVLLVHGHTDSVGTEEYNKALSLLRAQAVSDYLVRSGGIARERVKSRGFGECRPIATNDTDEGRERNRRVEIRTEDPNGPPVLPEDVCRT